MSQEVILVEGEPSPSKAGQKEESPSRLVRVKRRKTDGSEVQQRGLEVGKDEQIIRFPCSKVAQLCGLCHFPEKADLVQLVLDLVYQDLGHTLKSDCDRLGMKVVSEEEDIQRMMKLLSKTSQEALTAVRTHALNTTGDVQLSRKKVHEVLQEEVKRALLPQAELDRLSEQLVRNTNKRFGIVHENVAIDKYERKYPEWKVGQRNAIAYLWPFTVEKSPKKAKELPVALRCLAVSPSDVRECMNVFGRPETLFFLCGAVDGVATHTRADKQIPDRVVEVKHRVQQFKTPPPFYEVVQLTCYLRMLELKEGVIIQCLRTRDDTVTQDEADGGDVVQVDIQTDTVTLNEMHETGWSRTLLPRLQEVAEFVYNLRENDTDRLVFLANPTQVQCQHLAEQLPFLSHLC